MENSSKTDVDIQPAWERVANELDNGNREAASKMISEFCDLAKFLENGKQKIGNYMANIDKTETDGVGLDLAIKYNADGTPVRATILSAELNSSAKVLADFMDKGDTKGATAELEKVLKGMGKDDTARYLHAVDAYEKDGSGQDIRINYDEAGQLKSIEFSKGNKA